MNHLRFFYLIMIACLFQGYGPSLPALENQPQLLFKTSLSQLSSNMATLKASVQKLSQSLEELKINLKVLSVDTIVWNLMDLPSTQSNFNILKILLKKQPAQVEKIQIFLRIKIESESLWDKKQFQDGLLYLMEASFNLLPTAHPLKQSITEKIRVFLLGNKAGDKLIPFDPASKQPISWRVNALALLVKSIVTDQKMTYPEFFIGDCFPQNPRTHFLKNYLKIFVGIKRQKILTTATKNFIDLKKSKELWTSSFKNIGYEKLIDLVKSDFYKNYQLTYISSQIDDGKDNLKTIITHKLNLN